VNTAQPLLPIFPLGTVLFPGGVLPLRIFEARYMDMVRECMGNSRPFGVCLITQGREVGTPAEHEPVGCMARIEDWDMTEPGVLQLRTVGTQRFSIAETSVQADGLIRARIDLIEPDPDLPIPDEFSACSVLIGRAIDDICRREPEPMRRIIAEPYSPDSAGWVANRLAELLPLSMPSRQMLMMLPDPLQRLALIHEVLQREQVI
jgi:Lon protease-like protein